MKFFWSQNCSCDYRQIDTFWCPQPAHPAGTGNDAIHAALTLTGPRETTASLTRKMLSISAAGWLCPVIVILARLWHLCYVDGKCLSNHPLAALFEFSSTLMDSSWRIIIKKMKSSLTLNATASSTPWRSPTVLVTKAVDSGTASPSGLLPFSRCAAAQRLNLTTFLIVVEKGLVIGHVLSQTSQTPCPGSGAYIHVREQQHFRARVFLWLSQRLLNPGTCIDPPPIPLLSLHLIPHCFLVWNNIACLLLLIPEDWASVSAPLSLVLY